MPVVPFAQPIQSQSAEGGLPGPAPDETWSLMAAAQMHSEGRLVQSISDKEQEPIIKYRNEDIIKYRREDPPVIKHRRDDTAEDERNKS